MTISIHASQSTLIIACAVLALAWLLTRRRRR